MGRAAVALALFVAGGTAATVAAQHHTAPPAYTRSAFGDGWVQWGAGCDTRERVLAAESDVPPTIGPHCRVVTGEWVSPYDAVTVTDPRRLDIDHVVPLGEAWASGANRWTTQRRVAYANDIADPEHLVAVTAATNRSKGDRDPARWMPPNRADWCGYLRDWLHIKRRWHLRTDRAERAAITADRRAARCTLIGVPSSTTR